MSDHMPNVLLITLDCWRFDRCGFTGHHRETTPTLDAISADSYLFDRAYATGTYTTESVPGIVAGMHSYNGTHFGDDPAWKAIPPESPTIASHMKSFGYKTSAVLTNPHLSSDRNFDKGFDEFTNIRLEGVTDRAATSQTSDPKSFTGKIRPKLRSSGVLDLSSVIAAGRAYQYLTEWPSICGSRLTDAFLENLDATETPFFAWTHYMDIHRPIHPDVVSHPSSEYSPRLPTQFSIDAHASTDRFDSRFENIYDTAVSYVDHQIGKLVDWLQEHDKWENTILIVTGDHGEALYDRGRYGHPRHYPFDELLHVPLLVRDPNGERRRISEPFSLAWLGELIAELVDVPSPEFPDSTGRHSHLDPDSEKESLVVSDALDAQGHSITVRNGEYKYVAFQPSEDADLDVVHTPDERGYHTMTDLGERVPVDSENIPRTLVDKASEVTQFPSDLPRLDGGFSKDLERKLEQLGYKM